MQARAPGERFSNDDWEEMAVAFGGKCALIAILHQTDYVVKKNVKRKMHCSERGDEKTQYEVDLVRL